MLDLTSLKNWLCRQGFKRYEQLMLVIAALDGGPVSTKEIRDQAKKGGLNIPKSWNVTDILRKSRGFVIKTPDGWELSDTGKGHLQTLGVPLDASVARQVAHDLRAGLDHIKNADTKAFLDEAIECLERGLWRSAIVMSWIGALHLLYDHVTTAKLSAFNAEAKRINQKWKKVKTIDELASSMREGEFLNRLENVGIITNSVKKELKECLDRRNSCGHPNSYKPRQNTVAHHLETLLINVYEPFSK